MQEGSSSAGLIAQLLPTLVLGAIILFPFIRILRRIGRSGWWAALLFVPFGILMLPWIVAFMRWDVEQDAERSARVFQ